MKRLFTTLALACLSATLAPKVAAQNLLRNSSFDEQWHTPRNNGNIESLHADGSIPVGSNEVDLKHWVSPDTESPDYFATNTVPIGPIEGYYGYNIDISDRVNPTRNPRIPFIPHNYDPATNAVNGSVGLVYSYYGGDKTERIAQQLTAPLPPDRYYYAEFYVLHVPGADRNNNNQNATNFRLSVTDLKPVNIQRINYDTYPGFNSSGMITSDMGWVKVSGYFRTTTTARWLTIGPRNIGPGNPYESLNTDSYGYYIIDDVVLTECTAAPATPNFGIVKTYRGGDADRYNVSVANGYNTDHFELQLTNPDPPYGPIGGNHILDVYTGPTNNNPGAEQAQGYTTFPLGLIGPVPNGQGTTYRIVVTAVGKCGRATSVKTVTLPPFDGGGEDPYRATASGSVPKQSLAYPNPAMHDLTLPNGTTYFALVDIRGNVVAEQSITNNYKVNVERLREGLYQLRFVQNGKTSNQRIQIKH